MAESLHQQGALEAILVIAKLHVSAFSTTAAAAGVSSRALAAAAAAAAAPPPPAPYVHFTLLHYYCKFIVVVLSPDNEATLHGRYPTQSKNFSRVLLSCECEFLPTHHLLHLAQEAFRSIPRHHDGDDAHRVDAC